VPNGTLPRKKNFSLLWKLKTFELLYISSPKMILLRSEWGPTASLHSTMHACMDELI
jgi:hypothetical protein